MRLQEDPSDPWAALLQHLHPMRGIHRPHQGFLAFAHHGVHGDAVEVGNPFERRDGWGTFSGFIVGIAGPVQLEHIGQLFLGQSCAMPQHAKCFI